MNQRNFLGLSLVILMLLTGCVATSTQSNNRTPTPSVEARQYLTALEAYAEIRPTMLDWHEDARVVNITVISSKRQSGRQILEDGRGSWWSFEVSSPSADKTTIISLSEGKIIVGIDGQQGYEISMSTAQGIPINQMIDSNRAVAVVGENQLSDTNFVLVGFQTKTYDGNLGEQIPLSWALEYANPDDFSQSQWIFIDAHTGEIRRNDFSPLPPPPTVTSIPNQPPHPNLLMLRTYGAFDAYLIDPQGHAVGIDPVSRHKVGAGPTTIIEVNPERVTDDPRRFTMTTLFNPEEGPYQILLFDADAAIEELCELSIEIVKEPNQVITDSVTFTCHPPISSTYTFILSWTNDNLLVNPLFTELE
jgi:hypothetical protein